MIERDLVLLGGGHTHALVIRQLAMRPINNVRITLVSEKTLTPYSGMLPGFVAGHYSLEETHIDLNRLCQWAGVRWIKGRAGAIDPEAKSISVDSHTTLSYDKLSIDIGSTPDLSVAGAAAHAVGVKPVSGFNETWKGLLQDSENTAPAEWGVIGAGAGGVELVLAMAHKFRHQSNIHFHLLYSGQHVLTGYPEKLVSHVENRLREFSIKLHPGFKVSLVSEAGLTSSTGDEVTLDKSIWCTAAAPASWPVNGGLAASANGFIAVNSFLQSVSHADVYAVGDCSDMVDDPRPKAGVYAVRQAPFLTDNLRASLSRKSLKPVSLQSDFLSLLSLGDKSAVGCRSGWVAKGKLVWKLKHYIDTKFMDRLNEPQGKNGKGKDVQGGMAMGKMASLAADSPEQMHCAGCGSKLGPDLIAGNLSALPVYQRDAVTPALGNAEDASVWSVPVENQVVQSIDGFRSFSSDLWRFGGICVNHALSDIYAMGAEPVSAQVWINLAFSHPRVQKRDHLLLMSGIAAALADQRVVLAGGHSTEGLENHVAVVANGQVKADAVWSKNTPQSGDVLVLTKPLGTGVILAADMQARASARAVDSAFEMMLESNQRASELLRALAPSAVTDVTGFGLLGHLLEMLSGTNLCARLNLADIPGLPEAIELLGQGYQSTLYPQLQPYLLHCEIPADHASAEVDLLLDPQTSGGLLVSLNNDSAATFIAQYPTAVVVGAVVEKQGSAQVLLT